METDNPYLKNIEAYKRLGKRYLQSTKNCSSRTKDFVELVEPKGKILDVGCAGGRHSKIFTKKGFDVTGIDAIDCFLKEAQKNAPEAKFLKMDIRDIKLPPQSFAGIWANAVLLHVRKNDIKKVLKNFYRLLKKDGKLFVGVRRGRGEEYTKDIFSENETRFFVLYYKYEMEKLLKNSGFKIISSKIQKDEVKKNIEWIIMIATKR